MLSGLSRPEMGVRVSGGQGPPSGPATAWCPGHSGRLPLEVGKHQAGGTGVVSFRAHGHDLASPRVVGEGHTYKHREVTSSTCVHTHTQGIPRGRSLKAKPEK